MIIFKPNHCVKQFHHQVESSKKFAWGRGGDGEINSSPNSSLDRTDAVVSSKRVDKACGFYKTLPRVPQMLNYECFSA